MQNAEYLESFVDYLKEEEKSNSTIQGYAADVKHFMATLNKSITEIEKADVNAYKLELIMVKKLSLLSINRKMVSLRQFIEFLNDRFQLSLHSKIKQEKIQKQYSLNDEELLSVEDYSQLMAAVEDAGDLRTKAMFEAMYFSGMRVSEMLQLRMDHVQVSAKVINDIRGKGGKYRDIFISTRLLQSLQQYLEVRKPPYSSTTNQLFVGQRGPVTRQTVHNLMKHYAGKAGIPESKAHAHNLRHLFGLRLAAKGVPIQDIAKYMGHTSIEVTKIYTEKPRSYYAETIDQLV
ncbi:tyrosine-type recombinase/integrase [Metabacillus sp. FJAT-52054]|uniref:Tyrosine-type recombinase/integrase n=1 Tax=Metabacillus sediminis TaxID=3117746 RepID=A0ABZ2NNT7_9BACI